MLRRGRVRPRSSAQSDQGAEQVPLGVAEQPQHLLGGGVGGALIHIEGRHLVV